MSGQMTPSLQKLAEAAALDRLKQLTGYMSDEQRQKIVDEGRSETYQSVIIGFEAAINHLQAQAGEFSENEAFAFARTQFYATQDSEALCIMQAGVIGGARWQHQQMSAQVGLMREERDQYRKWNDLSLRKAHDRELELEALRAEILHLKKTKGFHSMSEMRREEHMEIARLKARIKELEDGHA